MRKFILFFSLFIPITCMARTLHIGNMEIPLYAEKITTPSINVRISDNEIVYAPMIPQFISNRLHVEYDNKQFSVCSGAKTHVGHYWFIGDCLVDADDDVYVEIQNDAASSYTNHIDTGINWPNTNRVVFTVGHVPAQTVLPEGYEEVAMFFAALETGLHYITYADSFYTRANTYPEIVGITPNISFSQFASLPKQSFDIEYVVSADDVEMSFGSWSDKYWSRTMKWYNVKIYDDDTILRHFIPVPAGMVIGNYTVPSNGMWDVVEQKFYGNSGTGDFMYGVDE